MESTTQLPCKNSTIKKLINDYMSLSEQEKDKFPKRLPQPHLLLMQNKVIVQLGYIYLPKEERKELESLLQKLQKQIKTRQWQSLKNFFNIFGYFKKKSTAKKQPEEQKREMNLQSQSMSLNSLDEQEQCFRDEKELIILKQGAFYKEKSHSKSRKTQ